MTAISTTLSIEHPHVSELTCSGNIRELGSPEKLAALKLSVQANGILVPLLGHIEGKNRLVDDGNHRLHVARELGMETVPMILADHSPSPTELLTLHLVANSLRFNLRPTERARAIDRLIRESGWSAAEVSSRLGERSESMISKLLTLLVLPKEMQDLIDAGRIPISSGYALATVNDACERATLVTRVLDGSLTRDELVKRIKSLKCNRKQPRRPRQARRPSRERVTMPLGAGRAITVVGPGLCVDTLIKWLEDLVNRIRIVNTASVGLKDLVILLRSPQTVEQKSE